MRGLNNLSIYCRFDTLSKIINGLEGGGGHKVYSWDGDVKTNINHTQVGRLGMWALWVCRAFPLEDSAPQFLVVSTSAVPTLS